MPPALRFERPSRKRAHSVFLGLVFTFLATFASADERTTDFDIPAQSLDRALNAFSEASGVQVFYETAPVMGRVSNRVKGAFDRQTALRLLLQGTDLVGTFIARDTISIATPSEADVGLANMKRAVVPYYGAMQIDIMAALCRNAETRSGTYRAVVQYWIASSGQISQVRLIGSSGQNWRDEALVQALRSITFRVPIQNV